MPTTSPINFFPPLPTTLVLTDCLPWVVEEWNLYLVFRKALNSLPESEDLVYWSSVINRFPKWKMGALGGKVLNWATMGWGGGGVLEELRRNAEGRAGGGETEEWSLELGSQVLRLNLAWERYVYSTLAFFS